MAEEFVLKIGEQEYLPVIGHAAAGDLRGEAAEHLGRDVGDRTQALIKWLPAVVGKLLDEAKPDGFHVSELVFTVRVEVSAFGTGMSGDVNIKYCHNSNK